MQTLNDAARLATGGYPGGLVALCARFGWNYETTRKQISGAPGFKLGAEQLLLISQACCEVGGENCRAILNAFAGAHEDAPMAGPLEKNLLHATVDLVRSSSDVLAEVTAARADGSISDNERRSIERVANGVVDNMYAILRQVERENEEARARVRQPKAATQESRRVPA